MEFCEGRSLSAKHDYIVYFRAVSGRAKLLDFLSACSEYSGLLVYYWEIDQYRTLSLPRTKQQLAQLLDLRTMI
jgi:hypothetical protein